MEPLTLAHVVISLVGIGSGFVVAWGMLKSRRLDGWTLLFLTTTVATSVTGFIFFPLEKLLPSHILAIISLAVLAVAILARYQFKMVGVWRQVYVVTAVVAQYLNFFVLIVQSFLKIPALHDLAPHQTEPAFLIAQGVTLAFFAALTVAAAIKFRPELVAAT